MGPPSPTPLFHLPGAGPAGWLGSGLTSQAAPVSALSAGTGGRSPSRGPGRTLGNKAQAGPGRPGQSGSWKDSCFPLTIPTAGSH